MAALASMDAQADLAGVATGGAINEDLQQKIWDLSAIPLEGLDRIGRGRVSAPSFSWIRDRLAAAADNAWVETASYQQSASGVVDFTNSATVPLNRFINHVQVSVKAVATSRMAQAVSTPGNHGSLAEQLVIANRELMRDLEFSIFSRLGASVAGNGVSTAARAASYISWLDVTASNNVLFDTFSQAGSGLTQGGWETSGNTWAIPTGTCTVGGLTETLVRTAVLNLFKNGACDTTKSLVAMTTPELKQNISTYMYTSSAKIGSFIKESGDSSSKAVGNVEYWQTDYALLELVANRLMTTLTLSNAFTPLWIFDPGQVELVYLVGPNTTAPSPEGLVDVRWTSAYWSTRFHPEATAGIVGINSATAMAA
jgi:hypothetical protein